MSAWGPRWLDILSQILSEDRNPVYTLSTVLLTSAGAVPRSRSVIHRGLITPSHFKPLLLATTDIRTPKAHQLHVNTSSEATFWFSKSNIQFRISAITHLLPHPSHSWNALFPRDELSGDTGFDWEQHRLKMFDDMSAHLRASFVRPVPGTPMESYDEAKKWPVTAPRRGETDGEEEERIVEQALNNFALVVLNPIEVDFLELGPIPNRRTKWTKKEEGWEEQIVVP
ncbi:hypothetical protein K439DRAFT_1384356 [Ramaria rubella]|nr:hypothetical protein K439DRAFT_1384356 [Ramaria rubella]